MYILKIVFYSLNPSGFLLCQFQEHCTQVDLEREISKTRDGRYRLRLQAIVLVV